MTTPPRKPQTYAQHVLDVLIAGQRKELKNAEIAASIVAHVEANAAAGEPWAIVTMDRWAVEGASRDLKAADKAQHGVDLIRRDGRRYRTTVAYSRPKHNPVSAEITGYQMQAWWDMSYAQLSELYVDLQTQAQTLGDKAGAVSRVLDTMQRHPECLTARQAWEVDGHHVDEIDLSA